MSNKLTDEQIAELAPDWATHYGYACGDLVFVDSKACKINKSVAKPIPRKKFDISEYEFSDAANDSGVEFRCSLWTYPDIEINVKDVNGGDNTAVLMKEHAIALAKHFKLTADDLK